MVSDSLTSVIEKVVKAIKGSDGPGYTDYPEIDIKAHRRNARVSRWLALIGFLGGVVVTWTTGSDQAILVGAIAALLGLYSDATFRLQALEWEVELNDSE